VLKKMRRSIFDLDEMFNSDFLQDIDAEVEAERCADDGAFQLKVRWMAGVERVEARPGDRLGAVVDRLAARLELQPWDLRLVTAAGEEVERRASVAGLGLTVASVLQARRRLPGAEDRRVRLKLQTGGRRAEPVVVAVRPTDTVRVIKDGFSEATGLAGCRFRLERDGEVLEEAATLEELELEDGECVDVREVEGVPDCVEEFIEDLLRGVVMQGNLGDCTVGQGLGSIVISDEELGNAIAIDSDEE
jgi:hypothetical protein